MTKNIKPIIQSSLEKIFPGDEPKTPFTYFSMLKNEKSSFQLTVHAKAGEQISWTVQSTLSEHLHFSYVKLIPIGLRYGDNRDDYYIETEDTLFPDLLQPVDSMGFKAEYDGSNVIWVEVKTAGQLPVGRHTTVFSICVGDEVQTAEIDIEVLDALLLPQTLKYTNWFHTDCLMKYYNFEVFSDEYYETVERFLRRAAEYGMNCVLTPLFTPALDTEVGGERPTVQLVKVEVIGEDYYSFCFDELERWIEMCGRCGIEYFEISHFFTQWGAKHAPKIIAMKDGSEKQIFGWDTQAEGREYSLFLMQLGAAFCEYADKKGIREKCLLHVSDEPGGDQLEQYKKVSALAHSAFPGFRFIDAGSDYRLYEQGLIDTPIPSNLEVDDFIGRVPELWTYYCCSQGRGYVSNRFFSMPSQRNRVLGSQLYKFDAKGFLQWGFNFYFSCLSKCMIDPHVTTDAGGSFPSGDSFVVYPGKNGKPLNSLRLNVFYDGLQDMRALSLLESKIGRDKTVALLEQGLEKPLTFREYPHSALWQTETRERINRAIIEN